MAQRVHSVRFMIGRGGNRRETYTVPAGRRAVVRHVAFQPWGETQQSCFLIVHGIDISYVYYAPGVNSSRLPFTRDVRFTAYPGETIVAVIFGSDTSYAVDGFLLDDDQGEPDDADNTIVPL